MSIQVEQNTEEKWVQINISGQFNYDTNEEFRNALKSVPKGVEYNFIVDLLRTEYIDSSGLSMLLLLREHAGGNKATVVIKGCKDSLKSLLNLSGFGNLFTIY